ncbi:hypothetical protein D3C78_729110 [compost metagenome]
MRLVDDHQATAWPTAAHGLDHRSHFGRVVAVVVDQHHAAAFDRQFAVHLEAAADALEAGQALDDGFVGDAFVGGDGDGGQGVEHVVVAGHVHRHLQRLAVATQHGEVGLHAHLADVDGADVGLVAEAIGHGRALDLWQDLAHYRVVQAHHGQAVERQVVQELDEGFLQLVEVTLVGGHVVGVDVGDHSNHRLQVQEAGVAFVGFGDQVTAGTQLRIGAGSGQAATDDERRVQATGRKYRGQQAGGGGLAMGTGNRHTMAVAHQLSEHFGTRHHWNTPFKRSGDFRVGRVDGAGHHQYIGIGGVFGTVANEDLGTERLQALGNRRHLEVGAGHFIAQVQQHFGNTAHAHAADTDEVDTMNTAHLRLGHGFLAFNHGPPPGRYRPRCWLRQVWPGAVRCLP